MNYKTLLVELYSYEEGFANEYLYAKVIPESLDNDTCILVGYGLLFANEWQLKPDTHDYSLKMVCAGNVIHSEGTPE